MAKQVQRVIGWVAAFLLAVGMLFLPVSKAYAGPVSGGSPGSGEMRGVWVSYLDWNGWAKDEAGYKKAMDQTLDLCVQKGLNAVFLQVRPDGDAMYPSQYFPWSKFASGKQGKNPGYDPLAYAVQAAHQRGLQLHAWINPYRITGYLNRYSDLCASNPAIAWAKDGDSSNDRWVLCQNGEYYYNPAIPQVRQLIIDGVKEIVTNYEVDGIHFDDYFYPDTDKKIDAKQYAVYCADGGNLSLGDWRRSRVNDLIRAVYKAVKEENQSCTFGISPAAGIANDRESLYADVETWATQKGYCDYLCPQVYFGFLNDTLPFMKTVKDWRDLVTACDLYIGLPLYKCGKADAYAGRGKSEFRENKNMIFRQIQFIRQIPAVKGFYVFSYGYLSDDSVGEEVSGLYSAMQ